MNVYQIVTERIIEKLQNGVIPWVKPWQTVQAQNFITKKPYHGVNAWLLYGEGSPYWITYKQAAKLGNVIKKEELGKYQIVTFWSIGKKLDSNGIEKKTFILRFYKVYNLNQTTLELPETVKHIPIQSACEIVEKMQDKPLILSKDQARAYYSPLLDVVNMPKMESFKSIEGYHATLFHELAHATGHAKRLNRETLTKSEGFASESYSKEELIAELASAMLCSKAGIQKTLDNSASYIQNWIKALQGDSKMIVSASSKAEKVVKYILNEKDEPLETTEA